MPYEIQKLLRAGRCGTLSRAHDLTTDRPCLVFDLNPTAELETLVEALRTQPHPRLPRIADVYREGATLVVVQDVVDGLPLQAEMKGGLGEKRKQTLAAQITELSRMPHPPGLRLLDVDRLVTTPFGSLRLADLGLDRVSDPAPPPLSRFLREVCPDVATAPDAWETTPGPGSLVSSVLSWCRQVGRAAR
ncbi:MAG: hypothetical protein ACYCW6_26675 [Candidatus Xenobia bacterium]